MALCLIVDDSILMTPCSNSPHRPQRQIHGTQTPRISDSSSGLAEIINTPSTAINARYQFIPPPLIQRLRLRHPSPRKQCNERPRIQRQRGDASSSQRLDVQGSAESLIIRSSYPIHSEARRRRAMFQRCDPLSSSSIAIQHSLVQRYQQDNRVRAVRRKLSQLKCP